MPTWVYYVGFAVLAAVVLFVFSKLSGGSEDELPGEVLADRADSRKHWVQAAQALYQSFVGDAGYWSVKEATNCLSKGWSTSNRQELIELIDRYISGECNVAFDKLRIIFLARVGKGAGWLDDDTSWNYAFQAIKDIQANYSSWEELRDAMADGRADWYGGVSEVPPQQLEMNKAGYQLLVENFTTTVPFR